MRSLLQRIKNAITRRQHAVCFLHKGPTGCSCILTEPVTDSSIAFIYHPYPSPAPIVLALDWAFYHNATLHFQQ